MAAELKPTLLGADRVHKSPQAPEAASDVDPADLVREIELATIRRPLLLRFPALLEKRFETDLCANRVSQLRRMIVLGLVFFNIYILSGYVTTSRWGGLNMLLRLCCMTPTALGICAAIGSVNHRLREALVSLGVLGATAIPTLMLALSATPLETSLAATEILPSVAYANTTMALRFHWGCFVTGVTLAAAALILAVGHQLTFAFQMVMILNLTTGFIYSLAAAYQIEAETRRGYLLGLRETLRSEALMSHNTSLTVLSRTDALTEITNRRGFDERLNADQQDRSMGDVYSVVLIDVDHFKKFNDFYGHGAGDACLREVARTLKDRMRPEWLISRYGGEEFACLLPGVKLDVSVEIGERLRRAVADRNLAHAARDDGLDHVSISIGVASTQEWSSKGASGLLEAADAALYIAKGRGRNQVCAAPEHVLTV